MSLLFNSSPSDGIEDTQTAWFKDKILKYKNNSNKIHDLFSVIGEKADSLKEELILFLLDNTADIEIFKNVSFFPCFESWSGSSVPVIDRKIEFLQSLLDKIEKKNDLQFLDHINYLHKLIASCRQNIKKTQIEEYINDFFA